MKCVKYVAAFVAIGLVSGLNAQTQAPSIDQLQQALNQSNNLLLAEQEKTSALSLSAANKTQQIKQLNDAISQQLIPSCISAVEKTSGGKQTLDPTTLTLKDKVQPEVAKK